MRWALNATNNYYIEQFTVTTSNTAVITASEGTERLKNTRLIVDHWIVRNIKQLINTCHERVPILFAILKSGWNYVIIKHPHLGFVGHTGIPEFGCRGIFDPE